MGDIFVLVEHRQGKIRDITYEMLGVGEKIAAEQGASLVAVLLGHGVKDYAEELASRASRVLVVEDEKLQHFNSLPYQKVLSALHSKYQPFLTLIGHTAFGMDLAPSLSVELGLPLATDCIGLSSEGTRLKAIRSIYGGKVHANVSLRESTGYLATIRPGTFPAKVPDVKRGHRHRAFSRSVKPLMQRNLSNTLKLPSPEKISLRQRSLSLLDRALVDLRTFLLRKKWQRIWVECWPVPVQSWTGIGCPKSVRWESQERR